MVDLDKESEQMKETISSASLLNLPELALITENAKLGEEFLNPSIGTWLNDRNAAVSKDLFLNKVSVFFCSRGGGVMYVQWNLLRKDCRFCPLQRGFPPNEVDF